MAAGRGPSAKPSFTAEVALELVRVKRSLRSAAGQPGQLLQVVRDAEQQQGASLPMEALCEVYHLAMRAFGPRPLVDAPIEYAEVCGKRLNTLRIVDPEEAELFAEFMAHYNIRESPVHTAPPSVQAAAEELPPRPVPRPAWAAAPVAEPAVEVVAAARPAAAELAAAAVPVRPRTLRYSSCDESSATIDSEEGLAAQAQAAAQVVAQASVAAAAASAAPAGVAAMAAPPPAEPNLAAAANSELSDLSDLSSEGEVAELSPAQRPRGKVVVVNGAPYEVLKQVGRGATCKVYEVRRTDGPAGTEPQHFALKRMRAERQADLKVFAEEVNLLMHLKDCPQVVSAIDSEVLWDRNIIHIVMELGQMDLGRMLDGRHLGLGDLQVLWRQMLESVQAIHELRVIHGDLKPGNFLLADGRLKLIDFGISKRIAGETTNVHRDGGALGTISYIAPEVIRKSAGIPSIKTGRASDVWSLGIILYQLVYGQTPFHDLPPAQRIATIANPDLSIHFPENHCLESHSEATRANLLHVLRRCLDTDSANRASIAELLDQPLLHSSVQEVTRSSFDRAMQLVVEGFQRAASEVALPGGASVPPCPGAGHQEDEEAEEDEDDEHHHACWRALSEELWSRLAPGGGMASAVAGRPADASSLDLRPLRACLQRWVDKGAKRQRTEAAPPAAAPAAAGAAQEVAGAASRAAAPCPAAPATRPQSAAAAASVPASGAAPRLAHAAAVAASGSAAGRPVAGARSGWKPGAGGSGGPRPVIEPGMLQQQRGCLRRGPAPAQSYPPMRENPLMQRMRERRAIMKPATQVVEDTTQILGYTPWGSSGG